MRLDSTEGVPGRGYRHVLVEAQDISAAVDLSPRHWALLQAAPPRVVRAGSFSHFVLNGSGFQIFGDLVQLGGPNSELLDNFRLGDSFLQIATLSCQLPKIAYVLHWHPPS
jgi:hypothetical protein